MAGQVTPVPESALEAERQVVAWLAAQAGARFAVAPGLSEPVVAAAHEIGLPFFPGVATPSEIDRAAVP
jgi:2-keto-3-deoxy-6-phosphogluconate aldolase